MSSVYHELAITINDCNAAHIYLVSGCLLFGPHYQIRNVDGVTAKWIELNVVCATRVVNSDWAKGTRHYIATFFIIISSILAHVHHGPRYV